MEIDQLSVSDAAEKIDRVLEHAGHFRKEGYATPDYGDPLTALLEAEHEEEEVLCRADLQAIRQQCFHKLLGFFFSRGPHPGEVVRMVYSATKAVAPQYLEDMSLEELGNLVGETKAAASWRIKRVYNGFVERRTDCKVKPHATFQKREETVQKYRKAQTGNQNRRRHAAQKRKITRTDVFYRVAARAIPKGTSKKTHL